MTTASEEQKILDIKVRYEDAIYGIIRYKEKIDALKESIKDLKQQEKDKTITTNEMKVQTEAINATIKEYQYNVRTLQKEIQNNVRTENEQEGSLKQLRAQLSNTTKAYDELSRAERESAKGQELQKKINKITEELKLAEEETQRFYRGVGNYYNSMLDLAADLQHVVPMGGGGGVGEFASGVSGFANTVVTLGTNLKGVIPQIKAFDTTVLGLAANPLFMALAGVVGAGMAFKWWFDYNKGLLEATRLTREFTGYTGDALETMRNSIAATADVMGKDFKEVLSTADALMAQYHLSGQEAMKVINDGFASGADLSGDMLSKIQQYAPTFHDAGIGASELVAILQQTRSGIFSDKGMDLITMASKKIREMSTGTASALDAIGISSKQVLKDLQSGSKSTFDIIQETAKKLKGFSNDSQEVGAVLKDVFGKQGAAAGLQLIEQLDTMTTKIDEVKEQTGAWGKTQEENIKLHQELNGLLSSMFDMSQNGFGAMITQGKQFGTKVLIQILKGLVSAINYFADWYNESLLLRGVIQTIGTTFGVLWTTVKMVANLIIDAFKQVGKSAKGVLDILEGIVTFDLSKAQQGFKEVFDLSSFIKEGWKDMKKAGSQYAQNFADGWNGTISGKLEHIEVANVDGGATSSAPTTGDKGTVSTGTSKKDKAKADKEAKEEAERQKQLQKQMQAEIAKVQFEYNEKVMDAKKRYLARMYDSEKDYQKDVDALEKDMIARSLDVYVQSGKIGEEKAQEMQQKLLDIMVKAKEAIKTEAKETIDSLNKEFEEAEKKRKETEIKSGGTGEEEDDSLRLQRYQAFLQSKLSMYTENAEVMKQLQKDIHDNEIALQQDNNKKQADLLRNRQETMADFIASAGDGLASFFEGEEKSFHEFLKTMLTSLLDAIEIAITAYYAQILAKELSNKSWAGVASAAAMMALTKVAFAGAKTLVKGFSTGGYVTGEGSGTSDSIPARLSNGESVMTAKATSMFSPILSAFNQLGGGVPIVVSGSASQIGEDMLAAAVAKGYAMAPRPVVSVEEISIKQDRVKAIERLSKM